jgi:type III restriction enzyme
MIRELDYQKRVLETLETYLDHLRDEKIKADKIAKLNVEQPDLGIPLKNFPLEAWSKMKSGGRLPASRTLIDYSERKDGIGRPVPNVVLKVPTGGGKTFLAVDSVSRVLGRYLNRNTGLVLWIVPNEAIYSQTLRHLSDRQHPYRQVLDRAAAGRVKILEKTDSLDARDVKGQLCVMILMLQSANRKSKDYLKIFKDRGDVHGFFPPEGEQLAHKAELIETPNLEAYQGFLPMVKDSLGNALRKIRPMIVLDEGHRAVADLAFKTLYDFNPCFVLELSATPHDIQARGGKEPKPARYANVLVEVTGKELDREGMIKMPLNLDTRQGADWKATLNVALDKLKALDVHAAAFRAETERYIRPIMLVQVERTGDDQRGSAFIHAKDVIDWLKTAGFDDAEIAEKTSAKNDLKQPENLDLLSPNNRVRAIITKSALQEGWDCPFAYVLCSLAASSNLDAMTQLVGRILRQPAAQKTGVAALDECHVITHHAGTGDVVKAIKGGLERDGLGDLAVSVAVSDESKSVTTARKINRRNDFSSTEIYLPKVLLVDGADVRELDYDTDIHALIDWRGFDVGAISNSIPENAQIAESQLQRISLTDDSEYFQTQQVEAGLEKISFDPTYATRLISDIVPNPFVGREIVGNMISSLRKRGFDDTKIGALSGNILTALRTALEVERGNRAETIFKNSVAQGRIQFRLRLDGKNWRMPFDIDTLEADNGRKLVSKNGGPLERSLFSPIYESELNSDEQGVAVHLDAEKALQWWHRNVARSQYGLQGWRRGKIYPDFIFAVKHENSNSRIVALETKGDQLSGNLDTTYKKELLEFISGHFSWDKTVPAGTMELVQNNGETVECKLLLMSDIAIGLSSLLSV